TQSFYDRIRRPIKGLRLNKGSYTELFTGSLLPVLKSSPVSEALFSQAALPPHWHLLFGMAG
ncbi:MAG: hypothetical protein LC541_17535, partial [Candidatus Thiodiazotropha sp.]|nr:hypothetical protein [Candidatus Thiodiazotropha sp.]MCM8885071.1 hypothetical protein [Candidatus Thiodiazotropha sp.]